MFLLSFIVQKMLNPTLVVPIMRTSSNCIEGINYQEQASRGSNDFQQSLCLHFKSIFFPNKSKSGLHRARHRRACRSLSVSGDIYHGRVSGQQTLDFNLQTPEISLSLSLFLSLVSHLQPHHWLSFSAAMIECYKLKSKAMPTLHNFS